MDEAKISISTYEKIKPWLEHKFSEFVKYEKTTKEWFWLVEEEIENNDVNDLKEVSEKLPPPLFVS